MATTSVPESTEVRGIRERLEAAANQLKNTYTDELLQEIMDLTEELSKAREKDARKAEKQSSLDKLLLKDNPLPKLTGDIREDPRKWFVQARYLLQQRRLPEDDPRVARWLTNAFTQRASEWWQVRLRDYPTLGGNFAGGCTTVDELEEAYCKHFTF